MTSQANNNNESRIPDMPDNRVAYQCECGKHWSMAPAGADINKKLKCKCGRTIVVQDGFIYSTEKVGDKAS